MKKAHIVRFSVAVAALVALAAPAVSRADVYVSATIGPRPVSFDIFYQELSPYGAWVQCEPYGWIWMPAGVGVGWQPYTTGYWGYTASYGYAWYADEVWGWAPFHYGNWVFTPAYGWAWVPGYSWGPAWVSWRYGAGFVAWAPLAPRYYGGGYRHGHGYGHGGRYQAPVQPDVRNDVAGTVDPKHYVVVPEARFADNHVATTMRREVGGADINRMQQVERLPQMRVAKNDANVVSNRLGEDGPGARDIARVEQGDLGSHAQALDDGRGRGRVNDLDTGRVREMGRDDATRTALPRLAPTPRLPAAGSSNDRVYESNGARASGGQNPNFQGVPRTPSNQAQPRVMPNSPRVMPSQPTAAPRINTMPRSAPVMRATPAPRSNFRAAPSSGPRAMPRSMPRGRP